jgi:CubicO group peptidase (beta-lactamase class C family)
MMVADARTIHSRPEWSHDVTARMQRSGRAGVAIFATLLLGACALVRRRPVRNRVADARARVVQTGANTMAFPGAYRGTANGIIAEVGVGRLDSADRHRPNARTVWDLASLTKVVGTTSAVMLLVQEGKIELDAPVVRYLPEWTSPGTAAITIRHLLTHSAGLPAWRPFYKEATSAIDARAKLFATAPDTLPGARFLYSDLGFILSDGFDVMARRCRVDVARVPRWACDIRYSPPQSRIAADEQDPWRQRHLRGEVHDENAAMLGGVSGHAGLFASGNDLVRFARMYLNNGVVDGHRVFDSTSICRHHPSRRAQLGAGNRGAVLADGSSHPDSPDFARWTCGRELTCY